MDLLAILTSPEAKAFAALVGASAAGAYGAWKLRGKKDERKIPPTYTGEPDHTPRRITRKEWHDLAGVVHKHGFKLANLEQVQKQHAESISLMRSDIGVSVSKHAESLAAINNLRAEFESHVDRWEDAGLRARDDREEMNAKLNLILEQRAEIMGEVGKLSGQIEGLSAQINHQHRSRS